LDELKSLAKAAGYTIVGVLEQVRKRDPRYQVGRGKTRELADLVKDTGAEKIIFDNELTPVQAYNLAKVTGLVAVDRFQLILEIFSGRASTYEAELQIQLASLRYELSRAKERVRLARMEEQPGFMGLGKYEVDLYYETVRRRIATIQDKLEKKREKRELHRRRRIDLGYFLISLAGYTNAGKSSLFNFLTEEAVEVDKSLFTTLSTTTRAVNFSAWKVLLTDTVGFIDRLPLTLVQAFHSTLEETILSDLILLVVDLSEPKEDIERKLSFSCNIIHKIGATGIPVVTVFNKIDLLEHDEITDKIRYLEELAPNPVLISALHGTNISTLKKEITSHLEDLVQASFSLPINDKTMSFVSWLHGRSDVENVEYEGDVVKVVFRSVPWFAEKVRGRVKKLGGKFKHQTKNDGDEEDAENCCFEMGTQGQR
jgi:GTP-binding protein HflX